MACWKSTCCCCALHLACRSERTALNVLVLVLKCTACDLEPGQTEAEMQALYWSSPGHANMLATCSYNQTTISRSTFRVVTVDMPYEAMVGTGLSVYMYLDYNIIIIN